MFGASESELEVPFLLEVKAMSKQNSELRIVEIDESDVEDEEESSRSEVVPPLQVSTETKVRAMAKLYRVHSDKNPVQTLNQTLKRAMKAGGPADSQTVPGSPFLSIKRQIVLFRSSRW